MKKKYLLLLAIAWTPLGTYAQGFQKVYRSNFSTQINITNDDIESIKTSDNNYLVVGEKTIKVDTAGVLQWGKTFLGKLKDVIEDNGNYVAAGTYQNDVYVVKFTSSGAVLWSNTYPLSAGSIDQANAIKKIADGYVIAGFSIVGGYEPFLMKIDFSGNLVWQKSYQQNQKVSNFNDVEVLADGSFLVTGWINTLAAGAKFWDALAMRVDQTGNIIWAKEFLGTTSSIMYEINQGPGTTFLLSGSFGVNEPQDDQGLLLFMDQSGNLSGSIAYADDGNTQFHDAKFSPATNEIFITGETDASPTQPKTQSIMYKTDASGNVLTAKKYGKTEGGNETGYSLLVDNNKVVMAGSAFDPNQLEFNIVKTNLSGSSINCLQFTASPIASTVTLTANALAMTVITGSPVVTPTTESSSFSAFTEINRFLSVTIEILEPDCNYSGVGKIRVTSSGTNNFDFYLTKIDGINQLVTSVLTASISAGQHVITTTSYQECDHTETIMIDNTPPPFTLNISNVNPACYGQANGSAFVSSSSQSLFYTWSNASQGAMLSNVAAGSYNVYARDFLTQCKDTASVTIPQHNAIAITSSAHTDATNCSSADGSITFSASGGSSETFVYSINGGSTNFPSGTFTGLIRGTYSLKAKSVQSNCSVTADSVIIEGQDPAPVFEVSKSGVCSFEQGVMYRVTSQPGVIYSWILPPNSALASGAGTNEVTVNFNGFNSGTLKVFSQNNSGCESDTTSISIAAITGAGTYAIPGIQVQCSQATFSVPIEGSPVLTDVLGLDFCMVYDENIITPTGTATIGTVVNQGTPNYASYYLNTSTPGIIQGVIYYTANAPFPTYFSGSGLIIDIHYTLNPGVPSGTTTQITLCGVTEGSLASGSVDACTGLTSTVSIISNPAFKGSVLYWNKPAKPLSYDSNVPSSYLATDISGTDQLGTPTGYTVRTDSSGNFNFNSDSASYVRIGRDIPGNFGTAANCTNVMSLINGTDQNMALKIATSDASLLPTIYQILAADVNRSGTISSLDISLMSARSVMSICGFPNNGTGSSIDWVFIPKSSVDTLPAYKISTVYPADDGIGYSKNRIPSIPGQFKIPVTVGPLCVETGSEKYAAILLGDVSGNWKKTDGATARTSEEPEEIVINIIDMIEENGAMKIPVYYNFREPVNSLDFYFEADAASTTQVADIRRAASRPFDKLNVNWNVFNQSHVLLSSYSVTDLPTNGVAFNLVVTGTDAVEDIERWSNSGQAFINGQRVDFKAKRTRDVTGTESLDSSGLSIYPNPATNMILIKLGKKQDVDIKLLSPDGRVTRDFGKYSGNSARLNVQEISKGMYLLQITEADQNQYYRRIIIR